MKKVVIKFLLSIVIMLVVLILIKQNVEFKTKFYQNVYDTSFSFATINNWYESKFGSPLPFKDLIKENQTVFKEKLKYSDASKYMDGVKLEVGSNYLVPSLEKGIVIFIGKKEDYGNTVIVQQQNGIDVWYSNLDNINVKLYDYIDSGVLIGEVNSNLYLKFISNGEVVDYKPYI